MSNRVLVQASIAIALFGCGAAPPPAPPPAAPTSTPVVAAPVAPPAKEPVETGSDCAKAEAECGGSVCTLSIKNACEQAVSCDATMATTCRSGAEMIESARRKRQTFAAKTDGEISLQGTCPSGEVLRTAVKSIVCK